MTFGGRLRAVMDARGPLAVGIDPHPGLLRDWGLADDPSGLERFTLTAVEALAPQVAVLKPQSAFFERHGSAGMAVLEKAIPRAREAGCMVLLDVKRADIGSTVQAYADAYLDPGSTLACDAVTAIPYLGFDALAPLIDTALRFDAGVFVVTLTSNPGQGAQVQHARTDGGTVAGALLDHIARRNADAEPMGSVGAVIGVTIGHTTEKLAINGPLLAPGVGAQGGTADDVKRIFAGVRPYVVPAASREVLRAGPDGAALRAAAARIAESMTPH